MPQIAAEPIAKERRRGYRLAEGRRVRYWAGAKIGPPTGAATLISGEVLFGGVKCFRIRKESGGTDYIARSHLEPEILPQSRVTKAKSVEQPQE